MDAGHAIQYNQPVQWLLCAAQYECLTTNPTCAANSCCSAQLKLVGRKLFLHIIWKLYDRRVYISHFAFCCAVSKSLVCGIIHTTLFHICDGYSWFPACPQTQADAYVVCTGLSIVSWIARTKGGASRTRIGYEWKKRAWEMVEKRVVGKVRTQWRRKFSFYVRAHIHCLCFIINMYKWIWLHLRYACICFVCTMVH